MTPELKKQMEEMAYAHAGMQSPSAEMRPYYERAYTEGFTAASEIYEAKILKILEDSEDARSMAESLSDIVRR